MKSCTEGKRHKWVFLRNRNCRTESFNSIGWVMRGIYKCACGATKYGEMQRVMPTDQQGVRPMTTETDLLQEAVALLRALAEHNVTYWSDDGEARFNPGKNQADSMRIFREARAFLAKIDAMPEGGLPEGFVMVPTQAGMDMQDEMRDALIDQGWCPDSAHEVDFAKLWIAGVEGHLEQQAMLAASQRHGGG